MAEPEPYFSYPSDEDIPWVPYEEKMSSSSDSDELSNDSRTANMDLSIVKDNTSRRYISQFSKEGLDPELTKLFDNIHTNVTGSCIFYPHAMYLTLKQKHLDLLKGIEELNYEECFVLLGRSLACTLNLVNNKMVVPKCIIFDACIFCKNNPVLVLSFVENNRNIAKSEKYNTYLAQHVTDLTRTYMMATVSVVNGVIVEGSDVKGKIDNMINDPDALLLSIPNTVSLSSKNGTLRGAIHAVLIGISHAKTHQFLSEGEEENPKTEAMLTLNRQEFEALMNIIDDVSVVGYDINMDNSLLLLEIACRKSRRRPMQLDLINYKTCDHDGLRNWYPRLQLRDQAKRQNDGHIRGELKHIKRTQVQTQGDQECEKTSLTLRSRVSIPGNTNGKRKPKGSPQSIHLMPGSNDNTRKSNTESQKREAKCGASLQVMELIPLTVEFTIYFLCFLLLYDEAVITNREFCLAKCAPLLFLIKCVVEQCRQESYVDKKCIWLLTGLVFSCIGDALFVWKDKGMYLETAMIAFGFAHLSYAAAFGIKPISLTAGPFVPIVTSIAFIHISSNLHGPTYYLVLGYTISISVMGWCALSKVDSISAVKHIPTALSIISSVFFLFCNIVIGLDIFGKQLYISRHVYLSRVTYYIAQLCVTMCILNSTVKEHANDQKSNFKSESTIIRVLNACLLIYRLYKMYFE